MTQTDVELLEAYLDGELLEVDVAMLRGRLANEPNLAAELEHLSAERSLRGHLFASVAADIDDSDIERVMTRFQGEIQRQRRLAWMGHAARIGTAAAACVAIGFLAGWLGRSRPTASQPSSAPASQAQITYDVAIRDDAGNVMGVQRFGTFEEAVEFREDLQRWQQRQEQLRSGQVTVRSAQF